MHFTFYRYIYFTYYLYMHFTFYIYTYFTYYLYIHFTFICILPLLFICMLTLHVSTYMHLTLQLLDVSCDVITDWHTIELTLLLAQELKPPINWSLDQLITQQSTRDFYEQ